MINEILNKGNQNAITGKELANFFGCDIRKITQQIEIERRAGHPICANMRGKNAGYFLPETDEELENYCKRLYHRGGELLKTRQALLATLKKNRKSA